MLAAWEQIVELLEHHPDWREDDKVLHLITSVLTLKAWAAHIAALESKGLPKPQAPPVIQSLQARQNAYMLRHNAAKNNVGASTAVNDEIDLNFTDLNEYDNFDHGNFPYDGTDWLSWGNY